MNEKLAFADQTIVHPVGLVLWAAMAILLFTVRRSKALFPVFLLACFIPPAQRVAVLGFDFTMLRLLLLVGWARILSTGEFRSVRLIALDRVIIGFAAASSLANMLLLGTGAAVVHNLGLAFDVLSSYFLVRALVRSFEDVDAMIGGLLWISVVLAVPFLFERFVEPHRNWFSVFGGINEFTSARQGKVRAHGAFPHAIIAGCFWAAIVPLFLARFRTHPGRRPLALAGLAGAFVMIYTTASSTPIVGSMVALAAAAFYPWRRLVVPLRWATALLLIGLHLVMSMPVWHLISRIDLVGGSTGWHRYFLIDQAIRRFPEWALIGTPSTTHWGHQLFDVTNQYVLEGVRGGIVALVLFLATIILAFRGVGRSLRATEGDRRRQFLAWMLGVSVFTHAGMFFAVSYFGQIYTLWYATLAAIASLEQSVRHPVRAAALPRAAPVRATASGPLPAPRAGTAPVSGGGSSAR